MNKLLNDKGVTLYPFKPTEQKVKINYKTLQNALCIDGLNSNGNSTEEANKKFIRIMKNVDESQNELLKSIKDKQNAVISESDSSVDDKNQLQRIPDLSHDVRLYTSMIHPARPQYEMDKPLLRRLRKLKHLTITPPYRRTDNTIDQIFKVLQTFPVLTNEIKDDWDLLKMLAAIIQYESHDEAQCPLFGNKAFYIILSGEVKPLCQFPFKSIEDKLDRFIPKKTEQDYPRLVAGDYFGTLDEIVSFDGESSSLSLLSKKSRHSTHGDEEATVSTLSASSFGRRSSEEEDDRKLSDLAKVLLARTASNTSSDNTCELVYITCSYYRRILEKYSYQKHADKLQLMKAQPAFNVWPQQALVKVANIMRWVRIPPDTILQEQNQVATAMGFIQSGSCRVFRNLKTRDILANGQEQRRTKQVLIGEIQANQTYGEASLLDNAPAMHTIVSKIAMKCCEIPQDQLYHLDEDVRLLLRQSVTPLYLDLKQEKVEEIYVEQKANADWNSYKESVISDVIQTRSIRPGLGKWNYKAPSDNVF